MDSTIPTVNTQPKTQKSSKNTSINPIRLLILAIIVGITLFLYIQNKQNPTAKQNNIPQKTTQQNTTVPQPFVPKTDEERKAVEKFKQSCKDFSSLEEALKTPELACILNLSGKGLSSLPSNITKLTRLKVIGLGNNNFTQFPSQLLEIQGLVVIDLSNNKLTTTPDVSKLTSLASLILTGNPITNKVTPSPKQALSTTTTTQSSPELKIIY